MASSILTITSGQSKNTAHRTKNLKVAYEALAGAMVPALRELATRTAKEVQGCDLLMDNNQISRLAEGLQRQRMEQEEAKRRLMQEQMFRLQEEERQMIYRQDLV